MGKFEVTQAEFQAVMDSNPSEYIGPNHPVDSVTWDEAVQYCQQLNTREQAAGRVPAGWSYRLPTEAEWEYACRANTSTTYYFGDTVERLVFFAWYDKNSGGSTHEVGSRAPNRWGLYDMMGNVWEWCSDWYGNLPGGNVTDPTGPSGSQYPWNESDFEPHVMRGGSQTGGTGYCTSSFRCYSPRNRRNHGNNALVFHNYGFRVVLVPSQ
jgi:formylglycine-generating enzyme required for sulfatase activity